MDFPYPAIRFKEVKGEIAPLWEKQKGDWKNLTLDEKKARKCIPDADNIVILSPTFTLQFTGLVFVGRLPKWQLQQESGKQSLVLLFLWFPLLYGSCGP